MKIGLIISAVIVLVLGAILYVSLRTPDPDSPTKLTSPEALKKVELPSSLPAIFEPDAPDAVANDAYHTAFALYLEKRSDFLNRHGAFVADPPASSSDALVDALIMAAAAGRVNRPFLDDEIPVAPMAQPGFRDALESIPEVALARARKLFEIGEEAKAIQTAKAVWALGQRAFEKCERLYCRRIGLQTMISAWSQLNEWSDKTPDLEPKLKAWIAPLKAVSDKWTPKVEQLASVSPSQGDLINMARHDEDPTMRIEAILVIGFVKYNPNHAGNAAAFKDIIEQGKKDPDPLIAKAAEAADAFTKEQLHKLR